MIRELAEERRHTGLAMADRRRSQRVLLSIPIALSAQIGQEDLKLEAHTLSINLQGAVLACSRSIPAGTRLQCENRMTRKIQSCVVTREPFESAGVFQVPMEFESPADDFWPVEFPAFDWRIKGE